MSRPLKTVLILVAVLLAIGVALHTFAAPFMADLRVAIHGR